MGLLNGGVPGNEAMRGDRLRLEDGEDIKEGSLVGVPHGISNGQEDGGNQGMFLYGNRRSAARRG